MESCACPANAFGCDGKCVAQSMAKHWVLADRVDAASRAQAGNEVKPNLRGVPSTDRFGRVAHITGFRVKGTMRVTAGATNTAVTYYTMLSLLRGFFLQEKCWDYLDGVCDGRDLSNDRWLRGFSANGFLTPLTGTAIATNVGAGSVDRTIDLHYPLTLDQSQARGHEAILGCIPLAAIKAYGDSAFRFTVNTAIAGAPAGLTVVGFQGDLDVWVELVYLDGIFVDQPWHLDNYTNTDLSDTARYPDRVSEYLVAAGYAEDNGGEFLSDFGTATHSVAGECIVSGYSLAEQVQWFINVVASDQRADDDAIENVSNGTNLRYLFVVPPLRKRGMMAAGPVSYRWNSRTRTFTRFLHRTVAAHLPERVRKLGGSMPAFALNHAGQTHVNGVPVKATSQTPILIPVKGQ